MIELNEDNLKELIAANNNVVVQYGAAWCGSCRIVKPKFKALSEKHEDVTFVYVDAEKFPESRKTVEVINLPTFASFKDGRLVNQAKGSKIENVEELVDEITNN